MTKSNMRDRSIVGGKDWADILNTTATSRTAGNGTGTALCATGTIYVTVTCDTATKWIILPLLAKGDKMIVKVVGATACEVRCNAANKMNGGTTADHQIILAAAHMMYIEAISGTQLHCTTVGYQFPDAA